MTRDIPSLPAMARLAQIMATLRGPQGCPWDAEQTTDSLKPYLIEEAYEVIEALDSADSDAICEELGDLLLQVVFHSRIFEERGLFDLNQVAAGIADKMVRRHPHVFDKSTVGSRVDLDRQWQTIKSREKKSRGDKASEISPPSHLPALMRAGQLIKRADKSSPNPDTRVSTIDRIQERLNQLASSTPQTNGEEMLGEILYDMTALGRLLGLDAEETLRKVVNQKIAGQKD